MNQQPDISYIVSLYNRPDLLACCLWSLKAQTHREFEVIVTDNTEDDTVADRQRLIVSMLNDKRFRYIRSFRKIKVSDCYWSAEYGMKFAFGRFLCFPCEDCYYPPEWAQRMLAEAYRNNLELVLCGGSVAGPQTCGMDRYFTVDLGTEQFPGYKPSFIVKADKFPRWINKPRVPACSGVDRTTLQHMLGRVRWGTVRDLYYVHN